MTDAFLDETPNPVSYTHLYVYKRQRLDFTLKELLEERDGVKDLLK